ncbi:MAG: hypothetical protein PVJ57_21365 [Phycisphaerae bacterium]|jgi:hypothetical protein
MAISLFGLLIGVAVLLAGYGKIGQRRRRRGFIIGGWLILGVQVAIIVGFLANVLYTQIDWIRFVPTSRLLPAVESGSWRWSNEYNELVRRLKAGKLSDEDRQRLATAAIAQFVRTDDYLFAMEVEALNTLRKMGNLSSAQTEDFFRHLVTLAMMAKPIVAADEAVPVRIDITPQADWSDCDLWCIPTITPVTSASDPGVSAAQWSAPDVRFGRFTRWNTVQRAGEVSPLAGGFGPLQAPTFARWLATARVAGDAEPTLACDVQISFFDQPPTGASPRPAYTTTARLSATTRVSSAEAATVKLTLEPELAPKVLGPDSVRAQLRHDAGLCQIAAYFCNPVQTTQGRMLKTSVYIYNTETGLAFDATLTVNGVAYDAGTICQPVGESWEWIVQAPYPYDATGTVTLTLTPNADLAASRVDLPEIWGRTVTIRNLPPQAPVMHMRAYTPSRP